MAEVRILSDYLTLILWISTVFIFNAVSGMKYFTVFSGFKILNLALAGSERSTDFPKSTPHFSGRARTRIWIS